MGRPGIPPPPRILKIYDVIALKEQKVAVTCPQTPLRKYAFCQFRCSPPPTKTLLVATSHRLASCVIVSGFRAALDLDTCPLRNFIRPRCAERAKPGRGKPVLIMHIGFSLAFKPYLSHAVVSAKSPHSFSFPCSTEAVGIAHKPPRSL